MPPPQGSSCTQGHTAGDLSGLEVTCRSNRRRWGRAKWGGIYLPPLRLVYWILCLHVPEATKASIRTICKMGTSVQTSQKWEVWGFCCTKPSRTALHSGPCSGGRGPAHTCLPTPTRAQVINLTSQMATQVEK